MLIVISRTLKEALNNFLRNGWLSVATISILFFSLLIVSLVFMVITTGSQEIRKVQEKINVSVYFRSEASEESINSAKAVLEKLSEVKSVEYVSKEQALEDFKKDNADDPAILKSLEEVGENPLLSYLVVRANNPADYEKIAAYVESSTFSGDVGRVNYAKNKEIISKFNALIEKIRKVGLILGSIFSLLAILITFNTIRITIYTHKQEIEIMRLVGASNSFIRLPFILEGIIYGLGASLVSMLVLFIAIEAGGRYVAGAAFVGTLLSFYLSHFFSLLFLQIVLGSFLGVVSGLIAMRKYLKV